MFEALRDLLGIDSGADEPVTPDQVRAAIARTESELKQARSRLERLEERRADLLLEGTDDEVDDVEEDIEETERKIERLEAARERLDDRLEEAEEAAETRRAIGRAEEALALKEEGEELLEEWKGMVERGCEILSRLDEIEAEVESRRDAFRRSPEHDFADSTPPLRAASLGTRNPNPVQSAVLPPAGPDSPRWNASPWQEPPRERSSGGSGESRGSMVTDAETGRPLSGGVGREEDRFVAPTGENER